jgi:hypothetical protein
MRRCARTVPILPNVMCVSVGQSVIAFLQPPIRPSRPSAPVTACLPVSICPTVHLSCLSGSRPDLTASTPGRCSAAHMEETPAGSRGSVGGHLSIPQVARTQVPRRG